MTKTAKKVAIKNDVRVAVTHTSYHYWRNFVKEILKSVEHVKFVKAKDSYNGTIQVPASQLEKCRKVLDTYKKAHQDEIELWW